MKLIRIDFTEQLGEGQYVEIRDPKFMPWGEQKRLMKAMKDDSMDSRVDFAEGLVIALVRNGNVCDEDGNPIMIPFTHETIELIPADVIEAVSDAFRKAKNEPAAPKK